MGMGFDVFAIQPVQKPLAQPAEYQQRQAPKEDE
jgi:hypothetical protein